MQFEYFPVFSLLLIQVCSPSSAQPFSHLAKVLGKFRISSGYTGLWQCLLLYWLSFCTASFHTVLRVRRPLKDVFPIAKKGAWRILRFNGGGICEKAFHESYVTSVC